MIVQSVSCTQSWICEAWIGHARMLLQLLLCNSCQRMLGLQLRQSATCWRWAARRRPHNRRTTPSAVPPSQVPLSHQGDAPGRPLLPSFTPSCRNCSTNAHGPTTSHPSCPETQLQCPIPRQNHLQACRQKYVLY